MANVSNLLVNAFKEEKQNLKVIAKATGVNPLKSLYLQCESLQVPLFDLNDDQRRALDINIIEDDEGLVVNGDGWQVFTNITQKGFNITGRFDKQEAWLL